MTDRIGAPGSGLTRRDLLIATGGAAALAGCLSRGNESDAQPTETAAEDADDASSGLPWTSAPEVVQADEQGGSVTLRSVTSSHAVHPLDSMGGPVELPQVWAFQADDRDPSVPGPIIRTTEGNDVEVTLDNTDADHPHTLHFHGAQKTWENDGVPTTTGITVNPGEKHTYTIPANVPGTHLYAGERIVARSEDETGRISVPGDREEGIASDASD
uniref:Multicopper oxidase domain-containing protein n=1 Tax=Haloterrigena alkaliphila TaxID=2816475 RepID=A0A8A2VJD9_9EURY